MKKVLILVIFLIIAAVSLIFFNTQKPVSQSENQSPVQVTPTISKVINGPVAAGHFENLELNLNIGKNSFASGEIINAILILKNTGDKEASIVYFPLMPFNIFLYDMNGTLLETFMDEGAPSASRVDVMNLKSGESISKTLNFSIMQPGAYRVAGAFIGSAGYRDIRIIGGRVLFKTEQISIAVI